MVMFGLEKKKDKALIVNGILFDGETYLATPPVSINIVLMMPGFQVGCHPGLVHPAFSSGKESYRTV